MARDPSRIPILLEKVREVWTAHPDMRLGQVIVNVTGTSDPFHVEDDVLLDDLNEWLDTSKNWSPRINPSFTLLQGDFHV